MPLHPSTIRLSKYNNQSRHTCPFRPNHNLDRFGWRSHEGRRLLVLRASLLPPYSTIYIFLIEIPVPFSLHTTVLHPSVSLRCSRDRPHQNPCPVVHGPLLTRLWYRKHNAIVCKLNLSLSLPRGSRIGYDAMICTTPMRCHALLLIALAHSTHFLGPRCGAIAMMLFLIPPLS
jgi:hypothetical protein